jgi:hypothetical protein
VGLTQVFDAAAHVVQHGTLHYHCLTTWSRCTGDRLAFHVSGSLAVAVTTAVAVTVAVTVTTSVVGVATLTIRRR